MEGTDDKGKGKKKEEKPAQEKPLMRGTLKVNEGKLYYSGKWAMSSAKFKEGEKARFKYSYMGEIEGDKVEPKNGKYSGSFMLKVGDELQKIEEKEIKFQFSKGSDSMYIVKGTGKNKFGKFMLEGKYDPETQKMALEKEYFGTEKEEDSDDEADFDDISEEDEEDPDIDDDGDDIDKVAELAQLHEEANMSVEELRRKYMGGGSDAGDGSSSSKRQKTDE